MPLIVAGSASIRAHSVFGERMMFFALSTRDGAGAPGIPPGGGVGVVGPSVINPSPFSGSAGMKHVRAQISSDASLGSAGRCAWGLLRHAGRPGAGAEVHE